MRERLRERGQSRRLGRRAVGQMSTDLTGGGGGSCEDDGGHSDDGPRRHQVLHPSSAFDANQLSRPMDQEGRQKQGRKCALRQHVDFKEREASTSRGWRFVGSRMRARISQSRSTRCLMAVLLIGTLTTTNYCCCLQSDRLSPAGHEQDGAVHKLYDELLATGANRQTPATPAPATAVATATTTMDTKGRTRQAGSAVGAFKEASGRSLELMSTSETNANQWPIAANNQSQVVAPQAYSTPLPSPPSGLQNGTTSVATGATSSPMAKPAIRQQVSYAHYFPSHINGQQSTQLMPHTMGRDLLLATAASGDALEPLMVSASKKKKKMMKKKKKMEKKHKEWKKGKKHKKKKYESKKKKGGSMKKKKGKKEKKKWGMEKKGHKKKGNFKKKKWGHKKKMKKGHKKGKKGHKMLKDKGHKKKGFKKVYHKEEWGKKKKWHDIKREKKWNTKQKKWKKKWHQEKGKKYKGKHMKKYHKKNKHGKKYKKEKKSKWKKHKGEKFKKGHKKKKEEYSKKKEGGKKKKMKKEMKKMKKKKG